MNEIECQKEKIGCLPYVLGGLSFIPLIGVLFGVIVIIVGITKRKIGGWKLITLGSMGIALTVLLYGSLFYKGFIERGGVFDDLSKQLAESQLTDLVKHIEYYRIQNGSYPETLEDLQPKDKTDIQSFVFIYDPMNKGLKLNSQNKYYYTLFNEGQKYYLFSSGIDGIPFTQDDIYPIVQHNELSKIGYMKK
ncbi:type II secretion system protein GspG [Desulfosediminicola flagellatus]|uniref:type II secretion system protein GspG n=1 Tax=Desulfosediminicola flagellatus TaxID=2569541 RepID=UPI0010AC1789|nr:type II secretion system protein GspG [Desulfosediminicola flagellatus]